MQPHVQRFCQQKQARFNPHPSRRTGATKGVRNVEISFTRSFNPHPSRRTGATFERTRGRTKMGNVSILTRPGGRVQPYFRRTHGDSVGFNPHPSRRTGATRSWASYCMRSWFQSSPVPEDGCNLNCIAACLRHYSFNPHPSRRTGATYDSFTQSVAKEVSILTRPGGRVQPGAVRADLLRCASFNPHPSRRTGATSSYAV